MDIAQFPYRVGTSGWTYDHWKGLFYPPDLPKSRWFEYYLARFSTVEVNATFYRTFKDQTYQNWRERVPLDFRYVLKVPRLITHRKYLENAAEDIHSFWRSATLLGEKLGLILLQVAPGTPYDLERLRSALLAFADPLKVAVEFRKKDWENEEVYSLLRELGAIYCSVDSPRSQLTDRLTSDVAYLRLHGRAHWYLHNYSQSELEEIAALARRLAEQGTTTVYIFFNNDFEGHAPHNAMALIKLLSTTT
jgi:uncharacterized protein YecE (DUF72 family)